jgi:hypothetical protein
MILQYNLRLNFVDNREREKEREERESMEWRGAN